MKHPRFLPSLAVLVAVPLMAAVVGSPSSVAEDNTADDAAIARAAYDPASDTERPVVEWDGGMAVTVTLGAQAPGCWISRSPMQTLMRG